jgi:hypothetical protein
MYFSASGERPAALPGRPSKDGREECVREGRWLDDGLWWGEGRVVVLFGERVGAIEARRVWPESVEWAGCWCWRAGLPL